MKLRKIIWKVWPALALALTGAVTSCNVLDTQPFESYDEATVWGTKATADAFVNGTISAVMNGYVNGSQTEWEERTNNTVHNNGTTSFVRDERDRYDNAGGFGDFGNIRRCNLIIEKAAEYSGQGITENESKELVSKGKFLRAALYYRQARTMGRFVWVDRVLSPADTAANGLALSTTRSTTESYGYIIKDLQDAIPDLSETVASGDISRDAGNALLSEVALQGAAYETDPAKRNEWLRIAISAVDNIKNAILDSDYGSLFVEQGRYSGELIFSIYRDRANTETSAIVPLQNVVPNVNNDGLIRNGCGPLFQTNGGYPFIAWMWWAPTQNLVDEYEVIDEATGQGVRWDESTQFKNSVTVSQTAPEWVTDGEMGEVLYSGTVTGDASISDLMYKNRDARFQVSIVHDDDRWWEEEIRMTVNGNLWRKANGSLGPHMTPTNYCLRKGVYYVQPRVYVGTPTDYHFVVTRYARALLNKAEAILWLAGAGEGNFADAVAICNQTRTVHGKLPAIDAPTIEAAWKLYQRERRIELVMENDYYWSLLRWGKHGGPANYGITPGGKIQELTVPPTYIEIAHDRKSFYVGRVTHGNAHVRTFREERRYLLPIPQGQIERNPNLGPQNPGW
ncbi:MAG: RagB/SusD family nutrient uptake outer membrane protein [Tannerella sp.]|jgi:hypothetical protein|nr:RagB/SusD family nutrient uptake outer membrane protein [Tannerella sp.]